MKDYDLLSAPSCIQVTGRFGSNCRIQLGAETEESLAAGRLVLKVAQMGPLTIEGLSVRVESISGQINLTVGNSQSTVEFLSGSSGHYNVVVWRRSHVIVGMGTTSNGTRIFADDSDIRIGSDCMFSDSVLIQAADQHAIVDIASRTIINRYRRNVTIGDHVWLGRHACVMADTTIGEGSLVGTGSVVTRDVPSFCVAAGTPARVVRTGTTWSRNPESIDTAAERAIKNALANGDEVS